MNNKQQFWRRCLPRLALCLLAWAAMDTAKASDMYITAVYDGSIDREFRNTTTPSGFCHENPEFCNGFETIATPLTYEKVAEHSASDVRDRFYIRLPGARKVSVQNARGEHYELTLMFTAIGQRVRSHNGFGSPSATGEPQGGCSFLSGEIEDPGPGGEQQPESYYAWLVKNPRNPQGCYSDYHAGKPGDRSVSTVSDVSIGYRLLMPNPHNMRQGLYHGTATFRVGQGAEFDLGNGVTGLSSDVLNIHFSVDVQHAFDLRFPPGSERAVLEPPGGWQAWLSGRGEPPYLERDLPFDIWSTGPFSVYKTCGYLVAGRCTLRNQRNQEVPVEVAVSMPPGVTYNNAPVRRVNVPTGLLAPLELSQATSLANRPGQLHFRIDKAGVQAMVREAGTTYTGVVTVVFNSEM